MNKNILRELNQRPTAYFPIYKQITYSVHGGVLVSQLMYWLSKKDKIFKTNAELMKELCFTERELKTAKSAIKKISFIKVSREGIPARTYYEIDWEIYEKEIGEFVQSSQDETVQTGDDETVQTVGGETVRSINDISLTETTTETTTENKKKKEKEKTDRNSEKNMHNDIAFRRLIQELLYKAPYRSKVKKLSSQEAYMSFREIFDNSKASVDELIDDYIEHQRDKKAFALSLDNFLLDYQTLKAENETGQYTGPILGLG